MVPVIPPRPKIGLNTNVRAGLFVAIYPALNLVSFSVILSPMYYFYVLENEDGELYYG